MDFNKYYEDRQKLVNTFLEKRLEKKGISRVDEAMAYSLLAGGKRIRPIILMATADALGVSGYNFLPVACGLEMIHTYSLIHDDLPCMDDDEYRRGRLTNHKVFGEALALLAGDALLTLAFEVMLEQKNVPAEALIETVREVAMCAGNFGMVGKRVCKKKISGGSRNLPGHEAGTPRQSLPSGPSGRPGCGRSIPKESGQQRLLFNASGRNPSGRSPFVPRGHGH